MNPQRNLYIVLILLFLGNMLVFAQNTNLSCDTALPACPDQNFGVNIPSEVGWDNAEAGPDYGCLATQPRPLWYYMQISQTGIVEFVLTQFSQPDQQGYSIDVDYIIWGPFESPDGNCNDLTAENIVDCSYHPAGTEYIDFDLETSGPSPGDNPGSAESGEFYLLMITNFGGDSGYINLQPTSQMTAEFNCAILGENYHVCDTGGDGSEQISLSEYAEIIGADEGGSILSFHNSHQDALNNENPLANNLTLNSDLTVVYTRFQATGSDEVKILFIHFILENIPELNPASLTLCDHGNDGTDVFNLYEADAQFSDVPGLSYSFYTSQTDAEQGNNAITDPSAFDSNPVRIFVRGENEYCYNVTTLDLDLEPIGQRENRNVYFCSPPEGPGQADLNGYSSLFIQPGDFYTEFYSSLALLNQGEEITNPASYPLEPGIHTVWVRIYHENCYDTAQLEITVLPEPYGETLEIFVCPEEFPYEIIHNNPENYQLVWTHSGETATHTIVNDFGDYNLQMTNIADCSGTKTYRISPKETIQGLVLNVTGDDTVVAAYAGNGEDVEFSLNDGPWQSSPVFENVSPGFHSVRARYTTGCVSEPALNYVIRMYNVLTPNGDGMNDRLDFPDVELLPGISIEIYNRYGKLIHSHIADKPFSWDGTYQGRPLPGGSYWYLIKMPDGRSVQGHITIKHY